MPKADYGAEDKLTQGRHDPITWEFARTDARRHARPMQLNAPRSLFCTIQLAIIGKLHLVPRARASTATVTAALRRLFRGGMARVLQAPRRYDALSSLAIEHLRRKKKECTRDAVAVYVKQIFPRAK